MLLSCIISEKSEILVKWCFFIPHHAFDAPLMSPCRNIVTSFVEKNYRVVRLPDDEISLRITRSDTVDTRDKRTERHRTTALTPLCIAS